MKKELQTVARIAGSYQVARALFSLKSSTWAIIDELRVKQNLTASQFIESLVMKASK